MYHEYDLYTGDWMMIFISTGEACVLSPFDMKLTYRCVCVCVCVCDADWRIQHTRGESRRNRQHLLLFHRRHGGRSVASISYQTPLQSSACLDIKRRLTKTIRPMSSLSIAYCSSLSNAAVAHAYSPLSVSDGLWIPTAVCMSLWRITYMHEIHNISAFINSHFLHVTELIQGCV